MRKHVTRLVFVLFILLAIYLFPKEETLTLYETTFNTLIFEVKGAIYKPGSYTLEDGSTLYDLIKLAGGLTPDADVEAINFGEVLTKSSYLIPRKVEESNKYIQTYNLNTITFQELINIPNITETRALNILLYREEHKSFTSVEELLLIKGIGDATYQKIKDYFVI
ncbi:MAG TPA: helix-hairpin-helix domain-containing protein [Acholeplasma sp.]|jgi:competence protein ComEA